jgi:hypothetical protein
MHYYQVNLLKDPDHPGPNLLVDYLRGTLVPALTEQGLTVFGVFQGLFGLDSNELYLVVNSESEIGDIGEQLSGSSFQLSNSTNLVPTERPIEHSARRREGIYVFRWFDVLNNNVEEIAALSARAWVTFEGGFDTEVQGLFAEHDRKPTQGKMLLITWYKNLTVWQQSRQPPEEARENFMRRQALTLQAHPIATRLVQVTS